MFETRPNNFLKLETWNPLLSKYVFVDVHDHIADEEFAKRKIPIRYIMEIHNMIPGPYVVRICTTKKRCDPGFKEVMMELRRKISVTMYPDYSNICDRVQALIQEEEFRQNATRSNKLFKPRWYHKYKGKNH